jgi:hypothetical protein
LSLRIEALDNRQRNSTQRLVSDKRGHQLARQLRLGKDNLEILPDVFAEILWQELKDLEGYDHPVRSKPANAGGGLIGPAQRFE